MTMTPPACPLPPIDEEIGPRYEKLALALMEAPDLGRALASLLGDHEARLDILARHVHHLNCVIGDLQAGRS
jgi:hypothetical protein